jgi:putative endonuclease
LQSVIPAKAGIQKERSIVAKQFFVYIMASRRNGTLYIGVTSNLVQRVWNHKQGLAEGFTSKYSVKMLVYFEPHETAESAITREKRHSREGGNPEVGTGLEDEINRGEQS